MKIGYARVSKKAQDLTPQIEALKGVGCDKIFAEVITGARNKSKEFDKMMDILRPGDTLVAYSLDRIGRSFSHLIQTVNLLEEKGININTIDDKIDTSTDIGKIVAYLFALFAEIQLKYIRERTKFSLDSAREKGRVGGAPRGMRRQTKERIQEAYALYNSQFYSSKEIAKRFDINLNTLYRWVSYMRREDKNKDTLS